MGDVSPIRQIRQAKAAKRVRFEALVHKAITDLPEEFKSRLENVDVLVEDWPAQRQLGRVGARSRWELLGLYEGVPLTVRGAGYNMVPPDRITIFRKPIEEKCHSEVEIAREIQRVVRHEIAHHFGISDQRLSVIERRAKGQGSD
ncbi:MAG: metallopeptidase family protein [Chloroflexota bacterium]